MAADENKSTGDASTRRDLYRVDITVPVLFRVAQKSGQHSFTLSPEFKGVGVNFSGSGAMFYVVRPIEAGTMLYFEMKFDFQPEPVRAVAHVVRTFKREYKGHQLNAIATTYLIIDKQDQDKLIGHLIKHGVKVQED